MTDEKLQKKIEELETKLETLAVGQSVICHALENAGLMKNGEPVTPRARAQQPAKWDPEQIPWKQAEGSKGLYQRYPLEGEKAEATSDYKGMLTTLNRNNGRMRRDGYFYWLFPDNATVGRKQVGKSKGEAKQTSSIVDSVKAKFPKDLGDLLLFEEKEQFIEIRPRQYLGSDNFAKIAAIVRDQGGEYVSAGKESHFRVPRGN